MTEAELLLPHAHDCGAVMMMMMTIGLNTSSTPNDERYNPTIPCFSVGGQQAIIPLILACRKIIFLSEIFFQQWRLKILIFFRAGKI